MVQKVPTEESRLRECLVGRPGAVTFGGEICSGEKGI